MKEIIILDVTKKPSDDDMYKLNELLSLTGAAIEYKPYNKINNRFGLDAGVLTITYDHQELQTKRTRLAGPKHKYIEPKWRIGEIKNLINEHGTKYVTEELQISKATLYRRLKYLQNELKYHDDDFFF